HGGEEAEARRVRERRGGVVGDRGEGAAHRQRLPARAAEVEGDLGQESRLDLRRGPGREERDGDEDREARRKTPRQLSLSASSAPERKGSASEAVSPAPTVTSRSAVRPPSAGHERRTR